MANVYTHRIKEILQSSDPNLVTAKLVRNQLETEYKVDLSHSKKEVDKLILQLFDELDHHNDTTTSITTPPIKETKRKKSPSPSPSPPPQKRQKKTKSQSSHASKDNNHHEKDDDVLSLNQLENQDAKLAQELQALENNITTTATSTRTRTQRKNAASTTTRPKKKTSVFRHRDKKGKKKKKIIPSKPFRAPVLLTPTLSEFLDGVEILPRNKIISLLWAHIRNNNLQNPKNRSEIFPDEKLAKVVGNSPIHCFKMTAAISKHMIKVDDETAANYEREHPPELDNVPPPEDEEEEEDDDDVDSDGLESPTESRPGFYRSSVHGKISKPKPKRKPGVGFNKPYQLSGPLSEVCSGLQVLSRPKVVKLLWKYIKKHDLQNPRDRREILLDDALKAIFGNKKKVTSFSMNKYIGNHLDQVDDNVLEDEIPVSDDEKVKLPKSTSESDSIIIQDDDNGPSNNNNCASEIPTLSEINTSQQAAASPQPTPDTSSIIEIVTPQIENPSKQLQIDDDSLMIKYEMNKDMQ